MARNTRIRTGDINADQVIIGDNATQIQHKTTGSDPALQQFFAEVRDLIKSQEDLDSDGKMSLAAQVDDFEAAIADLDGLEVGNRTKQLVQSAPFLRRKFEELVTGATGSLLATAAIQGIRLALGLL